MHARSFCVRVRVCVCVCGMCMTTIQMSMFDLLQTEDGEVENRQLVNVHKHTIPCLRESLALKFNVNTFL